MTPIKSIRLKCLDCCCGQPSEVRLCPAENCPLWPYRMGKRPKLQGKDDGNGKGAVAPGFFEENESGVKGNGEEESG